MSDVRGMLDAKELEGRIKAGDVDTVLVVFPDYQGRLVGKRVTGHFFLDHVLGDGIEACNYLLAVDVDMTVLPDFEFASWDKGYGDFVCRPDLTTLRDVPWLERTALVMCDLFDEHTGEPIAVSPRQILRDQLARAEALGYSVKCGSELEFFLFRDSYEEAQAKGYTDLTYHGSFIEDYHILQTTRDEYVVGAIRRGIDAAGIPVEFSKGEASRGQHEINLEYTDALTMADRHAIYKNAAKEIAGQLGRSLTFMAKYDMAECGSSCHIHSSVWSTDGATPLMYDEGGTEHMSDVFRGWLGGLLAHTGELAYLFAPTVNSYKRYQLESWAPTALAWGRDNRTCGFRVVGHAGASYRVESRVPGRRLQPVPRVRGDHRGRPRRDPDRRGPRSAVRRQRLRGDGRHPGAALHRRRDRRARDERRRQGRVRRPGPRAPAQHGTPGVDRVRQRRDRLGAPALLRAVLGAWRDR